MFQDIHKLWRVDAPKFRESFQKIKLKQSESAIKPVFPQNLIDAEYLANKSL